MYQYKFVEVKASTGLAFYFEGFEEIIEKNALDGWRFVTAIPAKSQGTGCFSLGAEDSMVSIVKKSIERWEE